MTPLRLLGGVVAVVGLALACFPTLVSDPGPAADTFEAIERRIPWGTLAGVGALLVARTKLRPWRVTFAAVVCWVTSGILAARLIGLVLDGADSGRQWMWVGVEAVLIALAGAYLVRKRNRGES
jgi:peptidoglycan/LPS O-acetylase OafA/YrhL